MERPVRPWKDVEVAYVRPGLAPASTARWFEGGRNLRAVHDLGSIDTSSVEDMACMFDGCSFLASLDVSGWDVSSVRHTDGMFEGCGELVGLDPSE